MFIDTGVLRSFIVMVCSLYRPFLVSVDDRNLPPVEFRFFVLDYLTLSEGLGTAKSFGTWNFAVFIFY